jgi:hypothetical protein
VKNNLNPKWQPFSLSSQELCGTNEDQELKVSCYDYDDDGGHDLIGIFTTTVNNMKEAVHTALQWECINPKKLKKKKYKNSGVVHLSRVQIEKVHTFVEFISNGCEINFTVNSYKHLHPIYIKTQTISCHRLALISLDLMVTPGNQHLFTLLTLTSPMNT